MKPYNAKYILAFLLIGLCSCGKFLEESSQSLMIPKTVKDFKEFLYGEGIDNATVLNEYIDIMSDDTKDCCPNGMLDNDTRPAMWSYYTWQPLPETGLDNSFFADNSWYNYYHKILIANVILDRLDNMSGEDAEKADLAGEAYFLRAWSYFMLVNLYGEPYESAEQAKAALGVPLNEETGIVDSKYERSSVAAVYKQIEDDLTSAIGSFKSAGIEKSIFRPSLAAANLLASRTALFQKKYEDARDFADEVIKSSGKSLYDLKSAGDNYFLAKVNTEIIYSTGRTILGTYFKADAMYKGFYALSDKLVGLYASDDLRLASFYEASENFATGAMMYSPNKWYASGFDVYANNFRLAEAYLNRAEAYAALDEPQKALDDLNELRRYRFADGSEYEVAVSAEKDAMTLVREERRIELAFEGFRWFDLRRYGCPRIEHVYTNAEDPSVGDLYVLEEKSKAYTLPVPSSERTNNPNIEQIDRPASNPVVKP